IQLSEVLLHSGALGETSTQFADYDSRNPYPLGAIQDRRHLLFATLEMAVGHRIEAVTAHLQNSSSIFSKPAVAERNSRCSFSVHVPASRRTPLLRWPVIPRLCRNRSITV